MGSLRNEVIVGMRQTDIEPVTVGHAPNVPFTATSLSQITPEMYAGVRPMRNALYGPDLRFKAPLDLLNLNAGGESYLLVNNRTHCLQTATRALRAGEDEEFVVMAVLHDMADGIAFGTDHGDMASLIMGPFISDMNNWILKLHVIFQDQFRSFVTPERRDAREAWRGHPAFEPTATFCEKYDEVSFDPNYHTMPLDLFEPMVRRVFSKEPQVRRLW